HERRPAPLFLQRAIRNQQRQYNTHHHRLYCVVAISSVGRELQAHSQLPVPSIKGDDLCIKITQHEYEKGLADCKKNLHGRLVMNKGDRGFYEFQFVSFEDMCLAWSMGTINLKPGVLRLSKWSNDFNSYTRRQTHTQIWIRLMELPQEYRRQHTLFEIASAIGTPLSLDEATKTRAFGHYARILVDMDLSRHGIMFKLVTG
ncbi:DUF4283 domain protein, partial [Trifolium medium]|nr:DUF4283 domain protein [Trifolium medium]